MSRVIAALLLFHLTCPAVLSGQAATAPATTLQAGARVRITQAGEAPRVAIVVAHTADSLVVQGPEFATDVALPLSRIARLEVSTGRHRNLLKGMALGTAIGGTAGLLLGAVSYRPCTEMCIIGPNTRSESAGIGGILLGTLGLVVGTLAGIPSHDSWQRVPLDGTRVAVAVGPRPGGTGFGVRLRY